MMVLVWTFVVVLILALMAVVFSGFLPTAAADVVGDATRGAASAATNLTGAGPIGIVTAVAALLLALLGGFFGGRLGSRYHSEIDRAG